MHIAPPQLEGVSELERFCLETFLEQDGLGESGNLHLLTAMSVPAMNRGSDTRNEGEERLLGLVFWREMDAKEMEQWMHMALQDPYPSGGHIVVKSPVAVGTVLSEDEHNGGKTAENNVLVPAALAPPTAVEPQTNEHPPPVITTASWVKIELLGTDRTVRGDGLARLLLGLCLGYAAYVENKTSAVLQIAGGSENNPAADHLYRGFGFQEVVPGSFNKPNDHIRVLWDIRGTLRALTCCGGSGAAERDTSAMGEKTPQEGVTSWGQERLKLTDEHDTEDFEKLPARKLKEKLSACGESHSDCLERRDLIEKLEKARLRGQT